MVALVQPVKNGSGGEFSQPADVHPAGATMSIDVFDLARANAVIEGRLPFSGAARLRADLREASGAIDFRLEGLVDSQGRPGARLRLHGELPLTCDRCARAMQLSIEHVATFYFVQAESDLAALPITADDQAEPLLGSDRFDVTALVEDETILSIPVSPRHAECPPQANDVAAPARSGSGSPFTALPALLRDKGR